MRCGMIRVILILLVVVVFLLVSALPLLIGEKYVWKNNENRQKEYALKVVKQIFHMIFRLTGSTLTVKGFENIPDKPVLYVGNHRSYFDIVSGYIVVPGQTGFVAKKEMEKIPLLPLYMRDIGCLFLDREDIKQGLSVIKQGTEYMKQGHSMVVFPEGTRNQTDTLLPFREGGYKMAEKSKSPIVPVSICRSDLMLESAPKKRIHSHSVTIEFGKPIYPCELPPKERKERYAEFPQLIQDMYDKNNI